MGRTRRNRRRKGAKICCSLSLEDDPVMIDLKKWMTSEGWNNETGLQLKNFTISGRGLTSLKNINKDDVLIRIPFNLLISLQTVLCTDVTNMLSRFRLKIHDYLSLFIINEKHKHETSKWKYYIKSLPQELPILPWLGSLEEIKFFPEKMRMAVNKCRSDFEESWLRVKESINTDWTCGCCGQKVDCVINKDTFTWAYVLVNSRAVHVDPGVVCESLDRSLDMVSDEPCMALCPYLDMFNHSCDTVTTCEIEVSKNEKFYVLRTNSHHKRYQQLYVSYGSHDNLKLLLEYGFFITGNPFDAIYLNFHEVLSILHLELDQHQYNFVKEHNLGDGLFVKKSGASFNLKAVIFVALNSEIRNYSKFVYSDLDDSNFLCSLCQNLAKLISHKLNVLRKELIVFKDNVSQNDSTGLVLQYLRNQIEAVEDILNMYKANIE